MKAEDESRSGRASLRSGCPSAKPSALAILAAHDGGKQHLKVTAGQLGISVATVRRALKKAGVTTRRRGLRDEAEWRRRIDLFNRFLIGGLNMAEAASEIGAGLPSVYRWAAKLGIELLSVKVCARAHRIQKVRHCRAINPSLSGEAIAERLGLNPWTVRHDLRMTAEGGPTSSREARSA